ncbi:site-specific integrase [uncultured Erythrobacter sp.]|uniref:tyrosine-type recombinase/integrase n=1 Tax=uncultured Erythrobacter sp. TaxID=263913 RepID=UPI002613C1D8|nr:site-specific integrase [uncultured Erythrobacter sp.]
MPLKFQRLTRPAIRALAKGDNINEHGIRAERLASGDVRYSVNIMVDGQRIHRVIGRESEGTTREQAERAIEAFRTKAREGRLDLPSGRKVHRTFGEAADDYMSRLEDTIGEGQKGYADLPNKRRHVDQYLVPFFGKHRADKVSDFLVKHYKRHRLDEGAKPATVNRELSTLSHMMSQIVKWKWIKDDERPEIEKDAEPRKKIVILSPEQAEALYKGAVADQDPRTWLFVAIGLNTAMRHSEILRIKREDIDLPERRIYIERAKAGQRVQPITASLAQALKRIDNQHSSEWLFPASRSGGKTPYRRDMGRQFERAVIRAGLDPRKVTPHVMRHTGITRLVQAGVDIPTIQKISGHKTIAMVMRYVHLSDEHIDDSIAAIDTGFLDTLTPELHTDLISGTGKSRKIIPLKP